MNVFFILRRFENASGVRLNKQKTKLLGFGAWKDRQLWPVDGITILHESITILGIQYSNNYNKAVSLSWTKIVENIKTKVNLLTIRKFNIYQRAIIINSLVLSKVWYTSHTYPLSCDQAKCMEKIIFPYIWNSKSNPLKRDVMYNKKEAGGINLLNVFYKAKSIYVNSFLRSFLFSGENESLIKYYCALQLNPLFKIRNLPVNVSPLTTPYYSSVTATLRACSKLRNFPNITSKLIYEFILLKQPPKVEEKYSLFNWKTIWKNLAFKCIRSDDRCILFKYLHEILPNNSRLYEIKRKPSPNCDMCNLEENNLHMMYYCKNKEFTVKYLRGLLQKCLDVDNISLIKMLFLDTTGFNK